MALTKITSTNIGANAVTSSALSNTAITSALGYTPANKAGDTFTGDITLTSSTTPNIYINSSNTSVNQNLWLRSNGTDTFGIEAQSNTGGAGAFLSNRSAGGAINFRTIPSGGSLQSSMVVNGSGIVQKPYQPYCLVGRNGGNVNSQTAPIPWNQVVQNVGSYFNTGTYRFTAPVSGYYFISINAMAVGTNPIEVALRSNGNTILNTRNGGGSSNYNSTAASSVVYLAANDYIDAKVEGSYTMSGGDGYAYSGMCCYLLG